MAHTTSEYRAMQSALARCKNYLPTHIMRDIERRLKSIAGGHASARARVAAQLAETEPEVDGEQPADVETETTTDGEAP